LAFGFGSPSIHRSNSFLPLNSSPSQPWPCTAWPPGPESRNPIRQR
jgi:hypothetical protein